MKSMPPLCGAGTRACRVETRLDTFSRSGRQRRHECRRGRHECPMPLSYLPFVGGRAFGGHLAFGERAGARPDLASIRTPCALWKFRLTECPEHLLHDLLALLVAGGVGEERQECVERILCLREAEPPRIQAERRAGLIH